MAVSDDVREPSANQVTASDGSGEGPSEEPKRRSALGWVGHLAESYSLLLLMFVVILFFSVYSTTSDTFPTQSNFEVTTANQSVLALVAICLLLPLICGKFDLSVGSVAGLSAVYVASAMSGGTAVPLAIGLGLGIGLLIGFINAFLVARLELDDVVATLGTGTLALGVIFHKTGGQSIVANIPDTVTDFGTGTVWFLPNSVILLLVVAAGVYFFLEHTAAGRQVYALGSNREAARLVGMHTRRVLGGTFVFSGVLAGLAGALLVARSGGADPSAGEELLLPAFAAAFLSAATVTPGKYNVGGLLIAVFFLAALNSGLNLAGAAPYVSFYVNGTALVVGVALATYLHRRRIGG
jgi:ribose transport system permease protein